MTQYPAYVSFIRTDVSSTMYQMNESGFWALHKNLGEEAKTPKRPRRDEYRRNVLGHKWSTPNAALYFYCGESCGCQNALVLSGRLITSTFSLRLTRGTFSLKIDGALWAKSRQDILAIMRLKNISGNEKRVVEHHPGCNLAGGQCPLRGSSEEKFHHQSLFSLAAGSLHAGQ